MGSYHHGNLKQALIEAGIRILGEQGEGGFSLRTVAAECGVSHAAPYNHFADKEALLLAIDEYVTQRFLAALHTAVEQCRYQHELMFAFGCAYVSFLAEHPRYYPLIFQRRSGEGPRIALDGAGMPQSAFAPFLYFRETALSVMERYQIPETMRGESLLEMWTALQGVAALFVADGFECADREEALQMLLRSRLHIR